MKPDDPRIYVQVLRHLQGPINDGTLRDGQPTPTIAALCRRFDCTRQTAAKALRILEDDGRLTRWAGLGYYVSTLDGPGPVAGPRPRRLPDERIDHPREFDGRSVTMQWPAWIPARSAPGIPATKSSE